MRDEVEDIAYRMDALSSNSMKSANKHSGFHRIEVAPTLDTSDCNPLKNQGGGNDRMRTEIDNTVRKGGGGLGSTPSTATSGRSGPSTGSGRAATASASRRRASCTR